MGGSSSSSIWTRLLLLLPSGVVGMVAGLFLLAFSSTTTAAASSITPPLFLGIAPEDEYYYSRDVIGCRDGSRSFSRDRLNDGFCDCPDGTDEPGTSACPESRFYCKNIGAIPSILFSSRVNDHICDCCDGSDEYDGKTSCPNTCLKDHVTLKQVIKHLSERQNVTNVLQTKGRVVDVEKFAENFIDLRISIVIEMIVVFILLTCFCHWHSRFRRRRYPSRN